MTQTDDTARLVAFATQLYGWLDDCYLSNSRAVWRERVWPTIRPYVELRSLGSSAWLELKENYPLTSLVAKIQDIPPEKLLAHGLSGAQLDYKFAVIDVIIDKLRSVNFPGRFRVKLVDAIDTILDSLIAAAGIATALKEIKDMLRHQITA